MAFTTNTVYNELRNPAWRKGYSASTIFKNDFPTRIESTKHSVATPSGTSDASFVSVGDGGASWASSGSSFNLTSSNAAKKVLAYLSVPASSVTADSHTVEVTRHVNTDGVRVSPLGLSSEVTKSVNLATNPRFTTLTGDTVSILQNLMLNPGAMNTHTYVYYSGLTGSSASQSIVNAAWSKSGKAVRTTWSAVTSPVNGDNGVNLFGIGLTPGETYTASVYMHYSDELTTFNGQPTIYTGATVTHIEQGYIPIGAYADKVVKCYATFVCPDPLPTTDFRLIVRLLNGAKAGSWMELSMADLYPGAYQPNREWFSGSYSPDPDLTPSWTGAENASASVLTGVVPTNTRDSSCKGVTSSRGLMQIPSGNSSDTNSEVAGTQNSLTGLGVTFTPGKWYGVSTIFYQESPQKSPFLNEPRSISLARRRTSNASNEWRYQTVTADNVAGEQSLSMIFRCEDDVKWQIVSLRNGSSNPADVVYWDKLLIVEGDSEEEVRAKLALGYFDGSTYPIPTDPNTTVSWAGTANASASYLKGRSEVTTKSVNLATNPRFSKTSGTTVVRTNLCVSPIGSSGWGLWSGGAATGSNETGSGIDGGPDAYYRATVTTAGSTAIFNSTYASVAASTTYWVSFWGRTSSSVVGRLQYKFTNDNGSTSSNGYVTVYSATTAGKWQKYSTQITTTSTATKMQILFYPSDSLAVGTTIDATGLLIEKTSVLLPYFDENNHDPDLTFAWTGTENASTSTLTGNKPVNVSYVSNVIVYSSQYGVAGVPVGTNVDTLVRVAGEADSLTSGGVTFTVGKYYGVLATCTLLAAQTVTSNSEARKIRAITNNVTGWTGAKRYYSSAAPNEAGSTTLSLVWQVPTDAVACWLDLFNGSNSPSDVVYWDKLLIVEGDTEAEVQAKLAIGYFDGYNAPDSSYLTRWTGTANQSSSVCSLVNFDSSSIIARSTDEYTECQAGDILKDWITFSDGPATIMHAVENMDVGDNVGIADIDFYAGGYQEYRPDFSGSYSTDPDLTPGWLSASDTSKGSQLVGQNPYFAKVSSANQMRYVSANGAVFVIANGSNAEMWFAGKSNMTGMSESDTGTALTAGKWYGFLCTVDNQMASSNVKPYIECISSTTASWSGARSEFLNADAYGVIKGTYQIPYDATAAGFRLAAQGQRGDRFRVSPMLLVSGDTEEEVTTKLEAGYFDGSTESVLYQGHSYVPIWTGTEDYSTSYFTYVNNDYSPTLVWSSAEDRIFEIGTDRGVFYPSTGGGIPWNGLISVEEDSDGGELKTLYMDGEVRLQYISNETWKATLKAYTAPKEFAEYDGLYEITTGFYAAHQRRKSFGLVYRTLIGNGVSGTSFAYKLHLVYNALVSTPKPTYETMGEDVSPTEFEWTLSSTPYSLKNGYLLSPHFILDSRDIPYIKMAEIESNLFGDGTTNATLLTPSEIQSLLES